MGGATSSGETRNQSELDVSRDESKGRIRLKQASALLHVTCWTLTMSIAISFQSSLPYACATREASAQQVTSINNRTLFHVLLLVLVLSLLIS